MHKTRSFPERLVETAEREHDERKNKYKIQTETLEHYREKDFRRTEQLARVGSPSSAEIEIIVYVDWRTKCCHWVSNIIDYILEQEEESKRQDEIIQRKSYAGFYYFIKWFVRAFFILVFTTLGTIAGKEVGCEIKDHKPCDNNAIELVDGSPHIVASIVGLIFGLLTGQWIGRYIWDRTMKCTQKCLRYIEKLADRSKAFLIAVSSLVYIVVTVSFATVFFFFVDIHQDSENIIGAFIGAFIGLTCAVLAYRKSSPCQTGQQTPAVYPRYNESVPEILRI